MARAEDRLREWRVMLPAPSTLERLVTAEVTQATTDLYTKISNRLPPLCAKPSICLVEVPEGDARSSLFRLKDYPKSANAAVIKGDIVRLRLIEQLLDTGAGLWTTSIRKSFANSASSDAVTMPAICAASPSQSATRSLPAIWSRPARR